MASSEPLLAGRGMNAVANRLLDQSAEIRRQEKHLAAARRRRDLLCLKLATGGASTRTIGGIAGMSSPGVVQALRRARAAQEAMSDGE